MISKQIFLNLLSILIFSCNKNEQKIKNNSIEVDSTITTTENKINEIKKDFSKIDIPKSKTDSIRIVKPKIIPQITESKEIIREIPPKKILVKSPPKTVDSTNKPIEPLGISKKTIISLSKPAIYPGCEKIDIDLQNNCLTKNIHKELSQILILNSNFETEEEYERRAIIKFNITTNGNIELDQVNSSDLLFKQYVEKYFIIFSEKINSKELKIKPALDDNGYPTKMNFAIPIVFKFI